MRRDIGFFLIQIYMPSTLVVIVSWISFWLNIEASPARVSLGLLTVLTMTTQSTGINHSMPRVSYIKAVDVWMSCCLMFVVCGLVEYAIVNVLSRNRQQPKIVNRAPFLRQLLERRRGSSKARAKYGERAGVGGPGGDVGGINGGLPLLEPLPPPPQPVSTSTSYSPDKRKV